MEAGRSLIRGNFSCRISALKTDVARALALRSRIFRGGRDDKDSFDDRCQHGLVEDRDGRLVACFRIMTFPAGDDLSGSYAARFYDVRPLATLGLATMELGRFCVDTDRADPNVLLAAWSLLTEVVDREGVGVLFGCSSFNGVDPSVYAVALQALGQHVGPHHVRPKAKAAEAIALSRITHVREQPQRPLPSLLRFYLSMGGWVGDHLAIDRDLGTFHIFTAIETARVPKARARALRSPQP